MHAMRHGFAARPAGAGAGARRLRCPPPPRRRPRSRSRSCRRCCSRSSPAPTASRTTTTPRSGTSRWSRGCAASSPRTTSASRSCDTCTARPGATQPAAAAPTSVMALHRGREPLRPLGGVPRRRRRADAGDAVLARTARRAAMNWSALGAEHPHGLRDPALSTCGPSTTTGRARWPATTAASAAATIRSWCMARWRTRWRF